MLTAQSVNINPSIGVEINNKLNSSDSDRGRRDGGGARWQMIDFIIEGCSILISVFIGIWHGKINIFNYKYFSEFLKFQPRKGKAVTYFYLIFFSYLI